MSAKPELAGQTVVVIGLELGASIAAFDATDFERLAGALDKWWNTHALLKSD